MNNKLKKTEFSNTFLRHITLTSLCLIVSLASHAKNIDYTFDNVFTMSVSDKMELRESDDLYTKFMNDVLNVNTNGEVIFQLKDLKDMNAQAQKYYCRIMVKIFHGDDVSVSCCNDFDFTQENLDEMVDLAWQYIEEDKRQIKQHDPNFNPNEYGFLEQPKATIEENSNGLAYIKVHYVRTGLNGAGNVCVDMCFFPNKDQALLTFFSYREYEKELWNSVLTNARNSINWIKRNETFVYHPAEESSTDQTSPKQKADNWWIWIILALALIGLGLYLIFKRKNDKHNSVKTIDNKRQDSGIDLLKEGEKLKGGRYEIVRHIASGGFGNTYEVKDTTLDKRCAIKEFFIKSIAHRDNQTNTITVSNHTNRTTFEKCKEKFKKEAQRLIHFNNQHIVKVSNWFEEHNTVYYVMDYIDGSSLSEKMKSQKRPFTEKECIDILDQILSALKIIHSEGLLHMDIKPGNIMIDKDGKCTLIDFGASKQIEQNGTDSTSTSAAYTPGYAPPEQISGNKENWGSWTDLYALGATLYYLISKKRPPLHDELIDKRADLFIFQQNVSLEFTNLLKCLLTPRFTARPQSVEELYRIMSANNIRLETIDYDKTSIAK